MERQNQDFRNYYQIIKKIGEGFGTVYEAISKETSEKRALKIIDKNTIKNYYRNEYIREPKEEEMNIFIDCFKKEIENMKICQGENSRNRNFVHFYEYFNTQDEFVIVMELCNENMLTFISSKKNGLSVVEIKKILIELNNAFKRMNKNKIIYRDLRLENILIKYENKEKTEYSVKLKIGNGIDKSSYNCFISPEILRGRFYKKMIAPEILKKEKCDEKCDLWNLGVIIYILFFKKRPYNGKYRKEILAKIENIGEINTNDNDLSNLLNKLLKVDPNERLTWEEYFNHSFFNQIPQLILRKEDFNKYYELGENLGEGAFGKVCEAINKITKEKRAIKIIDKHRITQGYFAENFKSMSKEELQDNINKIYNEIKIMTIVYDSNNENTVKLFECFDSEKEFALIMELCDQNLLDFMVDKKTDVKEIKEILEQLNHSFRIMYKKNLVHMDLKLQNILVKKEKENFILKLSDYGVSKQLSSISRSFTTRGGTAAYMAPEVLEGNSINYKCDLWSLGIIIYNLYFHDFPYKGQNDFALLKQINSLGQSCFKKTPDDLLNDLIKKLLIADPKSRIGWEEYFNHPFFNSTNENILSLISSEKETQIIFKLFIKKSSVSKEINILNNVFINNNQIDNNNTELYINDEKKDFIPYFKTSKEGKYKFKIVFKNKIKDCNCMFNKVIQLNYIDLSGFDTSQVENMSYMFNECFYLQEIDLNNLKVENIKNMSFMFNKCNSLKKIEFPESFKTKSLETMESMFNNCQNLSEIIFPITFITDKVINMNHLFDQCYSLKKLNLLYFNTQNVKDMGYMFNECNNLEEIIMDPTKFKTNNASNMSHLFNGCNSLSKLNLTSFNLKNVKHASYMFSNCKKLKEIDLSKSEINKEANMTNMFSNCINTKIINISSFKKFDHEKLQNLFANVSNNCRIIVNDVYLKK